MLMAMDGQGIWVKTWVPTDILGYFPMEISRMDCTFFINATTQVV